MTSGGLLYKSGEIDYIFVYLCVCLIYAGEVNSICGNDNTVAINIERAGYRI